MKLFGRTEITTIEESDHLQFVVVRESGWIELAAPPVLVSVIVVWTWMTHHYIVSVVAVLANAILLAKSLSNPSTRLFVSQSDLIARGDVGRTFTDEVKIRAAEIKSLGYRTGGENNPSGLYADQGWLKQTCLISGLNKQQANAIADAISRKFPNIPR